MFFIGVPGMLVVYLGFSILQFGKSKVSEVVLRRVKGSPGLSGGNDVLGFKNLVEVVILKKLCAVILFVFLASLVTAGAALAYVRHEPDLRPVAGTLLGTGVVDGGSRSVIRALVSSDDDTAAVYNWDRASFGTAAAPTGGNLWLVGRDVQPFRTARVNDQVTVGTADFPAVITSPDFISPDFITNVGGVWRPTNWNVVASVLDQNLVNNRFVTIRSNDYHRLQLHSDDLGLYYNVPDSVVAVLRGGTGAVEHNVFDKAGYDFYGFTVGRAQARNIVNLQGRNPAIATADNDSSIIAVYLHATAIDAAAQSNAVSVPVPLNVTFDVAGGAYIGGTRFNGVNVAALPDIVPSPNLWYRPADSIVQFVAPFTSALRIAQAVQPRAAAFTAATAETFLRTFNGHETRNQFWNNRFAGMRAGDIRLVKVSVGDGPNEQIEYLRVDRAADLQQQRFVVVATNVTTGVDTVLGANDRLDGNGTLYRVVYRDRDGIPGVDLTRTGSNGLIVSSPAIIFAENPIIKQPDVAAGLPVTSHWVMGYKPMELTGLGLDGEYNPVVAPFDGTQTVLNNNLYPDYTRRLFGVEADALWHTAAAINGYGFELADVIRFPGTLAEVPVGNTAVVLYTLRPGAGFGGSAGLDMLVGHAVNELQLINATGDEDMPLNYNRVNNLAGLADGTFAVMEQVPGTPWMQRVIADENHVFQAGKVYFLAVAARDGGDYDVDQGTQGNNVGKNNRCVHFSVFATVGAPAPSVTPSIEPTVIPSINPSETPSQAPVSDGSSDGCSVSSFAPAAVILLAPLFLLLKK